MGFSSPTPVAPPPPPPPPNPPTLADASVKSSGQAARQAAAAAAGGMGFGDTLKTGPLGDADGAPTAKKSLLGS